MGKILGGTGLAPEGVLLSVPGQGFSVSRSRAGEVKRGFGALRKLAAAGEGWVLWPRIAAPSSDGPAPLKALERDPAMSPMSLGALLGFSPFPKTLASPLPSQPGFSAAAGPHFGTGVQCLVFQQPRGRGSARTNGGRAEQQPPVALKFGNSLRHRCGSRAVVQIFYFFPPSAKKDPGIESPEGGRNGG